MVNPFMQTRVDAGAGNAVLKIWRGENDPETGEPIYTDASYDDYGVLPRGEAALRITGLRQPREEPNKYHKADDPKSKPFRTLTAVEFEAIDGPLAGTRIMIDFLTLNLSSGGGQYSPSNLWYIFNAACPNGGEGVFDMLGGEISAFLTQKLGQDGQPRYNTMTYETCAPYTPQAGGDAQAGGVPAAFRRAS